MTANDAPRTDASDDPYTAHDAQLRRVHATLLQWVRDLTHSGPAVAPGELAGKTAQTCRALLFHHHAEATVLFPHLRRAGRLRSADAAFLDACEREHRALHALCERLRAQGESPHVDPAGIATLAAELAPLLAAHVADEEAGLAPDRLRAMLTLDDLAAMARDAEAARPR